MKWILLDLIIFLTFSHLCFAEEIDPNSPKHILQTKWNSIIKILKDNDIDPNQKECKIEELASSSFDFKLMAKLSLGRKHWPKLNKQQQDKFTQIFIEILKDSYREKISLYNNEELLFKPALKKKKTIQITMELVSDQRNIEMLYKFRKSKKGWQIYDVEIQGISILLTYRAQFDDILTQGSVEDFFEALKKTSL